MDNVSVTEDCQVVTTDLTSHETPTDMSHFPVYGYPGYRFWLIHSIAVASLWISVIFSAGVLIYTLCPWSSFYTRPLGERLVIYLAFCDLFFSLCHNLDHCYMLVLTDHPPKAICVVSAFLLISFTVGQAMLIIYTAVSVFWLVVLGRRIPTGPRDVGLLVYAYGIPAAFCSTLAATGYLGPSGAWCAIDMRRPAGPVLANFCAVVLVIAFLFNVFCYLGIWIKIQRISTVMTAVGGGGGDAVEKMHRQRNQRTVRAMMCVVAAYIAQWWAYIVYSTWGLFATPHLVMFCASVCCTNMGGLFNCLAYTFVRRRYRDGGKAKNIRSQRLGEGNAERQSNDNCTTNSKGTSATDLQKF